RGAEPDRQMPAVAPTVAEPNRNDWDRSRPGPLGERDEPEKAGAEWKEGRLVQFRRVAGIDIGVALGKDEEHPVRTEKSDAVPCRCSQLRGISIERPARAGGASWMIGAVDNRPADGTAGPR